MHIETINIHLQNAGPAAAAASDALQQAMRAIESLKQLSSASAAIRVVGNQGPTAAPSATTATLTPPAPGQPWPGQGGIYVCTLPAQFGLPARHLVVGTNEAEELAWGGYSTDTPGAASQTDGRANTAALVASTTSHPAAEWAAKYTEDGHTDYHLPSRFELFMCWLSAPQVFNKSGWYWSSSQYSRGTAWIQGFEYGDSSTSGKDNECRARAVRWIHQL